MRPPLYRAQLVRDLDDWIAAGLVGPEQRAAILAHVDRESRFGLSAILGLLGAALIVAAILSFIAANWQGLDKLPRLAILGIGLWGAIGLAVWARLRRLEAVSEIALLIAIGVYGASVWFVGQTYHLPGGADEGLMLWALGGLAVGILAASPTAMVVGFLIAIGWIVSAWWAESTAVLWLFPVAFAIALAYVLKAGWFVALQTATLAAVAYMITCAARLGDLFALSHAESFAGLGIVALGLWATLHLTAPRADWTVRPLRFWMLLTAILATLVVSALSVAAPSPGWMPVGGALTALSILAAGMAASVRRLTPVDALVCACAAAALFGLPLIAADAVSTVKLEIPSLTLAGALLVWFISIGLRRGDRAAVNLGFIGFGLWTIYLYAAVFNDFLDGALFFAIGGVLLIVLALALDRVRRTMLARSGGMP